MSTVTVLSHPDMLGTVTELLNARRMRERRTELGWSLRHLAERAGVSWRTAQNAEHGEPVRDQTARAILRALDEGEHESALAEQPDLETITVEIDGMKVVVTGVRDRIKDLDLNALLRQKH